MKDEVIRELALPADFSICYVQAALIVGLQSIGSSRNFHEIAGTMNTAGQLRSAEDCISALLKVVSEVKDQVITDSQSNPQRSNTIPGSFPFPGIPTEGAEGTVEFGTGDDDVNPLI